MADQPLTDEEMRGLFGDGGNAPAPAPSAAPAPASAAASPPILSPEEERALFPPAAPAAAAAGTPPGVTPANALEAFQTGTLQGMGNVAGGIQRLFGYDPTLTAYTESKFTPEQKAALTAHPWAATGGRILGETAATAPVMIAGGELLPGVGASVPALVARGGLYGGLSGAAGNVLTSGGAPNVPLLNRAITGAGWGIPFGMLGGYGEAAAGAGQTISPATQAAGQIVKEAGIDVAPGNLPRAAGTTSLGGPPSGVQAGQINKAWGNIIGENTPDFSPATLSTVIPKLGQDVGNTVRAGKLDYDIPTSNGQTFEDRLADIEANTDRRQIKNLVNKVVQKVGPSGEISGDDLGDLLKTNNPLDSATRSRIPEISEPASDIEAAIHDAFTQSSPPGVSQVYSLAREKYKIALAGEAATNPMTGNIDPSRLVPVMTRMYPDFKRLGTGQSLTDQAVNFSRNTAQTFGGAASASPVYSHGGWLAPIATTAVGAAEAAPHILPFALPQTLSNPLVAGTMLAAPLALRGVRTIGHAYQETPSFANALLARGQNIGNPYLATLGGALGASLGSQGR